MFFRRGVSGPDRWLELKIVLFSLGAFLALFGMTLRNDWLIGLAGLVLAAGLLARFLPAGEERPDSTDENGEP